MLVNTYTGTMSGASAIPFWTMLAAWAQVVVLIVTARFVWRYLQETERLRKTAQEQVEASQRQVTAAYEQLEGQIRPAIVVRHGAVLGRGLRLFNVGEGPALHIRLSPTERGSARQLGLDLMCEVGFIEVDASFDTGILAKGGGITALNGRSLQCEYTSLSGRTYWTVVDFDKFDNDRLIATRFYSAESLTPSTGKEKRS